MKATTLTQSIRAMKNHSMGVDGNASYKHSIRMIQQLSCLYLFSQGHCMLIKTFLLMYTESVVPELNVKGHPKENIIKNTC